MSRIAVMRILRCPECGEQVSRPEDERQDGHVGHWHPAYSHFVKAEEVEVIPVDAPNVLTVDEAKTVQRFAELVESEAGSAHLSNADFDFLIRLENWASENPESTEEGR